MTVCPEATLHFGADSNARLWINGTLVCRKVTRYHEAAATVDVVNARPHLRTGTNVVVVLHHNWGPITTFQRPVHGYPFLELEEAPSGVTVDVGYADIPRSQYDGPRQVDPRTGWIDPTGVVGDRYADRYVVSHGGHYVFRAY